MERLGLDARIRSMGMGVYVVMNSFAKRMYGKDLGKLSEEEIVELVTKIGGSIKLVPKILGIGA